MRSQYLLTVCCAAPVIARRDVTALVVEVACTSCGRTAAEFYYEHYHVSVLWSKTLPELLSRLALIGWIVDLLRIRKG